MNSIPNFLSRSSQTFQYFLRIVPWSSGKYSLVQWNWFFDITECTWDRPVSLLPALGKPSTRYRPLTFCNIWWSKSLSRLISSVLCLKSQQHCNCCTWLIIGSGHWRGKNFTVFLDFRKAFDRVWHPGLLYQLSTFGVSEWSIGWPVIIWMSNFCSRWIYYVGVQDYLLWCLARLASWSCSLYRIYQQPSIHCEHSHWNLCCWHYPAPWAQQTPFMSYPALQEAIDCTEEWAESWHGKFGLAKTRILSTNKDIMLEALTPTMEGHAVTVTDNHQQLRVVLSENLKWSKHAQCILAAASKRAGLLRLMARDLLSQWHQYFMCTMFVLCWNMPVLCGMALSGKRTQCPWKGYRPVLRVVFSKLTGLHQKRNYSDSSAGQHFDGDRK